MNKSLYHQLGDISATAVYQLIGGPLVATKEELPAAFKNNLRKITALPDGFTIGDALIAYIRLLMEQNNIK